MANLLIYQVKENFILESNQIREKIKNHKHIKYQTLHTNVFMSFNYFRGHHDWERSIVKS